MARHKAMGLAEAAPDLMRELLAPHVPEYVNMLLDAMRTPTLPGQFGPVNNPAHRTAMQLIAQILRAIGSGEHVVNQLILQLGGSLEQAKLAVAMVGRLPDDPHAVAAECRAYLEWYDGPSGPGKAEVVG